MRDPSPASTWIRSETGAGKDPLFAFLLSRRQTAKVDYDTSRPVLPQALQALQTGLVDPGVRFGGTIDPARIEPLRTLCWESARVELLTARTVMESVHLTRVGPDEIARHRDGISVNSWLPRIANAVGAFDRSNPPAEGSTAYRQMMDRFEGHSRTAMGFVWLSTPTGQHAAAGTTRSAEVQAGRAYMRLQLRATALGLQMHPMSQAPQEFAEMKPWYERPAPVAAGQTGRPGNGADVLPYRVLRRAAAHTAPRTRQLPAGVAAGRVSAQVQQQPAQRVFDRGRADRCTVTCEVLHIRHHLATHRPAEPHHAHRFAGAAPGRTGDTGDCHGHLGP